MIDTRGTQRKHGRKYEERERRTKRGKDTIWKKDKKRKSGGIKIRATIEQKERGKLDEFKVSKVLAWQGKKCVVLYWGPEKYKYKI